MELVQQYGCCYNSFIAFSLVQGTYYVNLILLYCIASGINAMLSIEYIHSEEIDDQIEYAVLAREIFTLCGVQNPGFCTGVSSIVLKNLFEFSLFHRSMFPLLLLVKLVLLLPISFMDKMIFAPIIIACWVNFTQ